MSEKSTPDHKPTDDQKIVEVAIVDEMKRSYLDYAMSVIVSRALPDVRDGLKPVHRRILFSMHENGFDWSSPYRKSARVVGDVIGKYHPHGDSAIYEALARMAQDFSLRLPLIDGQGNFGSIDGDPPAAMRYTEVRLAKTAEGLLTDIDKDTVNFVDNYDNTESEPTVLPAVFPNILINGSGGIAVGMATNIPPHNLEEVGRATIALIENPELDDEELFEIVPGPDFPTGGIMLGNQGALLALKTGRGSITVRSRVTVEEDKNSSRIVVSQIPYQVNKSTMIEKIAELVNHKRIEGISDIRDESDRDGIRVVFDLKRNTNSEVVLNQLYRLSMMQSNFSANLVALNSRQPQIMNLRSILQAFIQFREDVVARRTKFLLRKARDRAHVLVGLAIAVANINEVITLIRAAATPAIAREELTSRDWPARDVMSLIGLIDDPLHRPAPDGTIKLSSVQARAILELRLQRLTALGRDEIDDELTSLANKIDDYLTILSSRDLILDIVKDETRNYVEKHKTPRRTDIIAYEGEFNDEDLIAREDMVVTVSHAGYIKRVPLDTYRAQRRGGKGRSGMATKEQDFVTQLFVASTHNPVLFFSSSGQVYRMKVWKLPLASPTSRGRALVNMLPLKAGETITSILMLPEDQSECQDLQLVFATKMGRIRRNELSSFEQVNRNGKIAMALQAGDEIAGVALCQKDGRDVIMCTRKGLLVRFPVSKVRLFSSRNSSGVRGIRLAASDYVISMSVIDHVDATVEEKNAFIRFANKQKRKSSDAQDVQGDLSVERASELRDQAQYILSLSEKGYGKRTIAYEYRVTGRGGKGVVSMVVDKRNGDLIAAFPVKNDDQVMLVTDKGRLIRCPVKDVSIIGRNTKGVTIFDVGADELIVNAEVIDEQGTS